MSVPQKEIEDSHYFLRCCVHRIEFSLCVRLNLSLFKGFFESIQLSDATGPPGFPNGFSERIGYGTSIYASVRDTYLSRVAFSIMINCQV